MKEEYSKDGYRITTDRESMDAGEIHGYLSRSYWARGRPRSVVEKSIRHSLCFGLFEGDAQIGFARVVTDYATFAYLADVFVLESHHGLGLGKWLLECVMAHPELQGLHRWNLATRDAHGLYARHGFTPLSRPEDYMEIMAPNP